jgi:hypothetical protein
MIYRDTYVDGLAVLGFKMHVMSFFQYSMEDNYF